ncbi:MAG: hypothetical protein HY862_12215 [Chloroflexi bacterium]|nr:hypothetical protein [Chloroflexota bacterium]
MTTVFVIGLVLVVSFLQFTHRAEAVLTSLGSETILNSYTTNNQSAPQVAVLPNGNFVTVWESEGEDGSGKGIFARFYNSSGTAIGSEIQINVFTTNDQRNPHVAVSNSAIGIVWESRYQFGSALSGVMRLFDFSGAALTGEIQISTLVFQKDFGTAFNSLTGDVVVTWSTLNNVYFQRFNSAGAPQGSRVQVNGGSSSYAVATSVAVNPLNGDFIVVWRETNLSYMAGDVYYRRYNASGTAYGAATLLSTSSGDQSNPYITSNHNGNFVAVWDVINGTSVDIYGTRIAASGALAGTEFRVNSTADDTVGVPKVTMDSYANFVVAWSANDGSSDGIYARSFNGSAVAQDASPILVNTTTASAQNSAGIAINSANVTFVVWSSSLGGFSDVYGRRMDGGFPLPSATIVESGGTTAITEGGATDSYTVVLTAQPSAAVTITADPDGQCDLGAGAGNPITLTFNSASAPLWSTPQTVTVTAVDDSLYEGNHTCVITHSASSGDAAYNGVTISNVTATITDNDPQPTLSINDVTLTEGDSGTINATFTVTLTGSSAVVTTVNVATANDTATAPADFTAISSTPLTFNPGGPLTQTVTVVVNGDTIDEGASEQFFVNLSGATNATISDGQGVGTITDDDSAPVISIDDVTITEGNSGTVNAIFTVSLSNGSASVVTVDYITANDTATAPSDFTTLASNTLTFNPGGTLTQTVTVVVNGDTIDEGTSEQFFVNLSGATNATVGDNQGAGTITDDDNAPVISIDDVTVTEGNSGTVNAIFTVSLSNGSASVVTVDYITANDTATAPSDFTALASNILTFNPGGALTQTVTVVVNGDTIDEGASEQFFVNLSGANNATVRDNQGTGTITDDDAAPSLSINDVTVTEGDSGTVNATFTVSLNSTAPTNITVNYATANDTATAPSDYTALSSTTLTFNPGGALTQTITVVVNGDTMDEGTSEQFFINLSGATNATIGDAQGVGTITDDDNAPSISINDVTVIEGNSGTVNAIFTVSLSNGSASVVTVNYATANDTATAPSDYTALSSTTLTFNPGGALTQTVTVVVNGDAVFEGVSERFFVNLSGAVNATIGGNQGIGTITDDDTPRVVVTAISTDTVLVENQLPAPSQRYIFTVSLATSPTATVTINLNVSNSQIRLGRPGGPYNNTLSLTFVPTGVTPTAPNTLWNVTQTVEVVAVDDTVIEALNQTSQITLAIQAGSAAEYVALTVPAITVTVVDKDGADALVMSNSTSGQVSLLNTLQDLPAGSAYTTYAPGAPIQGQWVMGDWNDDGIETPGVYGGGAFYYTNNSGPSASWTGIWIGFVGRPAVVGRFDANYGNDCIGAVDSANFPPYGTAFALYFTCDLTHGSTPALTYQWLSVVLPDSLGYTGAHQFGAGDFNNDGIDSIAIRRGEAVAYTNVPPTTVNSAFDLAQYFGNPGLTGGDIVAGQYGNLIVGDWNNDGTDTFGLFYPAGVMYYRNDQLWNSGVYVRQRMAQPVGASALGTTWHPVGGASAGAGQAETTTQGSPVTPTPTKTSRRQRIESDDPRVAQIGKWTVQSAPAASGGRYVYSTASTDDVLTLQFEGTSVEIVYQEGPSLGSFTVVVDDVAVRTVIATQSATAFNRSTLINYLSDGPHTVQIVPIRGVIAIDAFVANSAE